MDDCVRSYDTVRGRVSLHNLKLHSPHTSTDKEQITLTYRAVGFQEVRF